MCREKAFSPVTRLPEMLTGIAIYIYLSGVGFFANSKNRYRKVWPTFQYVASVGKTSTVIDQCEENIPVKGTQRELVSKDPYIQF
jgi:hypothetical protein